MARLLIFAIVVGILLFGVVLVVGGIRRAVTQADRGERLNMSEAGALPKLSYGLLLGLIVYATVTAGD